MNIEQLGFNKWFLDRVDPEKLIDHQIARGVTVNKDSYTINDGNGDVIYALLFLNKLIKKNIDSIHGPIYYNYLCCRRHVPCRSLASYGDFYTKT